MAQPPSKFGPKKMPSPPDLKPKIDYKQNLQNRKTTSGTISHEKCYPPPVDFLLNCMFFLCGLFTLYGFKKRRRKMTF